MHGPEQNGNGALDVNGSLEVSGGELLALGSGGMVATPSTGSSQAWLSVTLDSAVAAGTEVQVTDADDKVLATFVTAKSTQSLVVSAAGMVNGEEYSVLIGGTPASTVTAGKGGGMGVVGAADRADYRSWSRFAARAVIWRSSRSS